MIGAVAASVHGVVRASLDADAPISLPVQQAPALQKKFRGAGFLTTLNCGDPEDPIAGVLSIADSFQNRVDLLVGLRGLEPAAFARAIEVPFQGTAVRFIGLEDFVAMIVFAGGPQVADAESAISAAGTSLDSTLLRRLAKQFGRDASELLEEILISFSAPAPVERPDVARDSHSSLT